ncbi:MAG: Holliday junction branch migration protein RuvA, partial [Oscillospiraceae bacterium]
IYSLTGIIVKKTLDEVILAVGGVAFQISVPHVVNGDLPSVGQECTLFTFLNVKEDALDLYGFSTASQQECFKILTGVSGVGPKAGLSILSSLSPDRVALAISTGDFKAFTAAQGVGPKLAQRIVLELKGKFNDMSTSGIDFSDVSDTLAAQGSVSQAISALMALGYSQSQAGLALSKIDTSQDVQTMIKQALRLISGGKLQ